MHLNKASSFFQYSSQVQTPMQHFFSVPVAAPSFYKAFLQCRPFSILAKAGAFLGLLITVAPRTKQHIPRHFWGELLHLLALCV